MQNVRLRFLLMYLSIAALSMACSKDRTALIPTYIKIPEVNIETVAGQGSAHHEISEIWVYADSQLLGAFPIPTEIPIVGGPTIKLDLFPGIRENAQASSPVIYPFLSKTSISVELEPEKTIVDTPIFTYAGATTFLLVESFEQSNTLGSEIDGDLGTEVKLIKNGGIEGGFGEGTVSAEHPNLEVGGNFVYVDIPRNGAPVYLEMEYSSDIPLAVGLRGQSGTNSPSSFYKLVLFPDNDWKKIYINFTQEVQALQFSGYQLVFLASYDSSVSKQEQSFKLDNLKLLHF